MAIRLRPVGCAKENPVRIRNDTVTVNGGAVFKYHWETGKGKQCGTKSGELPYCEIQDSRSTNLYSQ